jgi:hypothetical protein
MLASGMTGSVTWSDPECLVNCFTNSLPLV